MNRLGKRHKKNTFFRIGCQCVCLAFVVLFTGIFLGIYLQGKNAFWQYRIHLTLPNVSALETLHTLPSPQKRVFIKSLLGIKNQDVYSPFPDQFYLDLIPDQDLFYIGLQIRKKKLTSLALPVSKVARQVLYHQMPTSKSFQQFMHQLIEDKIISRYWNWRFLFGNDSHDARYAGLWGAIVGTVFTLVVTCIGVIPLGVGAAIYLEELAPQNRWYNFFDVNINNLASVPSVIFGIVGLAVFINFFSLPRSSALVAGLTLCIMTLPQIIVASREAFRGVPKMIREGALGIGASPVQITFHHVLPAALPALTTGILLGIVRAIGESAPLLMLGLVVFVIEAPQSFSDPTTVLPMQIYNWARQPEYGFIERAAAAILVLLLILFLLSAMAIWLREKSRTKHGKF